MVEERPWISGMANNAYRALIAARPDRVVSPSQHKEIIEYSREVFGDQRFAPWLRLFSAHSGEFKEGWLPDNFFGTIRKRLDPYPRLAMSRTFARKLMNTKQIPDIVSCVRGNWRDADSNPISRSKARKMVFATGETVFLKRDHSRRSRGTVELTVDDFDALPVNYSDAFVIQAKITQHATLSEWTPACVHTIRLTTFKGMNMAAELRGALVRVGRTSSNVVLASSLLRVSLDADTGITQGSGYDPSWTPHNYHPDTQVRFSGVTIPNFEQMKALVLGLHDRLPHVALIGWDMTVDQDGNAQIMEWNSFHPDIKFAEAATGPHFPEIAHKDALLSEKNQRL